ncbi:MAG: DUF4827 domain-containing protein [Muribaculaceae bacterium]|nr:DUF4827 domain-containing protein [Muribaculaceae bacterium]
MRNIANKLWLLSIMAAAMVLPTSCKDSESYTDLLRDEQRAVNSFLAWQNVEISVPEDSIFVSGNDAPFYRMDDDGTIYMQVVNPGDPKDRPADGDQVYFRFRRQNLKYLYETGVATWVGNMNNLGTNTFPTSFILGNKVYPSTTQFGTGIQLPMKYLGYYSEVNLVLKSYSGFPEDQTACIPYLMNIKYFKPEY